MLQDEKKITGRMLMRAADLNGARVLEIGCGTGRVTTQYANGPRLLVGMDPGWEDLRTAAAQVNEACFLRASGMELPFEANSFDVVLYTLSLHHHPDPAVALDEARRIVVPHGRIVAVEPVPGGEVQRMHDVISCEDDRLNIAEAVLRSAPERVMLREVFDTEWVFPNFDAAAERTFNYYSCPPDYEGREAHYETMQAIVSDRADCRPFVMTDTLRITSLQVAAGDGLSA